MPTDLLSLARRQRKEINAADLANLKQVIAAYTLMYDQLGGDIDALIAAIREGMTPAQVKALPQYKRLMRHGGDELERFTVFAETIIGASAVAAIGLGLQHSAQLVGTVAKFQSLTPNVMSKLLDYLRPDGPLYARLKLITNGTVEKVVQAILDGVGSGMNPRKIADAIEGAFGGGLTDALRKHAHGPIVVIRRESARANYQASGVVTGWIWWAELDADTCEACLAEHGSIHDLDEQLDGHYNCRCAPIPYIEGITPDVGSGEDYFNSLPEAEQRALLGPGKYDALKAGKFTFDQLAKQVPNDIYGTMRQAATLKDLIGEGE